MTGARKVRVMVVDDSIVIRGVLSDVISSDPALEVAGTAVNGAQALERLPRLHPDLITLDIEMPEMDGLEALTAVRRLHPRLPVIMFSTLTQRGATATIEALTRGASDYVTKPTNVGSMAGARQAIRDQLIPKIKSLCARLVNDSARLPPLSGIRTSPLPAVARVAAPPLSGIRTLPLPAAARAGSPSGSGVRPPTGLSGIRTLPRAGRGRVEVVVIGVSTGGPNALAHVLPELPADFPVPVLIVQHMPPVFTNLLAERLGKASRIPIKEAAGGERLAPRRGWLAPGGYHLEIAPAPPGWALRLQQEAVENSCRPAADVLFRSAATAFGPGALGVVMTGMGQDGLKGCEAIRAGGGQVIVQDEDTSVVWGMPGSIVRAGLADNVVPLDQLAGEIVRRVRAGRDAGAPV
ncbi:protein-glutamate methylesterase/protein-glutamine glutaminase [Frigoriglobus tundricola]|uniref:Protein-glutamate methylesterase/protein-glutamine glutaminase n=1 Tax=Frigoriglobus tundricola TaxID=2774151 RepID=A0A6M5YXB0_9BACT|nr:chemotaxis response regulator protein-glutamate methylesterase [Frigoriglobus tundricola]QJW98026.1 Chemotaxis response regulator protein-glutamate methylesterase CheB [Frigoriglobus tundricola]